MNKYTRDPNLKDFINWLQTNPQAKEFYKEEILPLIETLEGEDYFGTEGFDKRGG